MGKTLEPLSIINALTASFEAHDRDKMFAHFADDVELIDPNNDKFMGKSALEKEFDRYQQLDMKGTLVGERKVVGDKVIWTDEITYKPWNGSGGPRNFNLEAIVKDGKIKKFTITSAS